MKHFGEEFSTAGNMRKCSEEIKIMFQNILVLKHYILSLIVCIFKTLSGINVSLFF
jgi:hypothetical protein